MPEHPLQLSSSEPPVSAPAFAESAVRGPGRVSMAVMIARIVLVVTVCGVIGALPYLSTRQETEIVSYRAPKEIPRPAAPPGKSEPGKPSRLWGVIVPVEADVWFFKLTGPVEDVAGQEPALRAFLSTVRFAGGEPQWMLPADWTRRPGDNFRYATLVIPSTSEPLELTVSKLSRGEGDFAEQLLSNVNRWRGQVSLPPLAAEELADATERLSLAGQPATLVNYVGVSRPGSMGRPPFAPK